MANEYLDKAGLDTLVSQTKQYVSSNVPSALSDLTDDSTHRTVTDAEKTAWNNKVDKETGKSLISTADITQITTNKNAIATLNASDTTTGSVAKQIKDAIAGVTQFDYEVVTALPTTGVKGKIYLITNSGSGQNIYDEYIWISNKYELLGTTQIDISGKQDKLTAGTNITINGTTISATDTTYEVVTTAVNGLMSNTDKIKLDGVAENANNYTLPTASSSTLGGVKVGTGNGLKLSSGKISVSVATTAANGAMTSADKTKLDGIESGANNYSLPTASSSVLGGIKVGTNLSITDGVLSAIDTTYGAVTTSANGLMTSTDKTKLNGIATGANNYSLPTASSSTLGGVKVGTNLSISNGVLSATDTNTQRAFYCTCATAAATAAKVVTCSDTTFKLETGTIIVVTFTYSNTASSVTLNVNDTGAKNVRVNNSNYTSTSSTYCGYASRQLVYMYDGTGWAWIGKSWDNNTTYSVATTAANGLMSSADKTKLNGIADNATANTGTVTSVKVQGSNGLSGSGTVTSSGTITISNAGVRSASINTSIGQALVLNNNGTASTSTLTSYATSRPTTNLTKYCTWISTASI